MTGVKARIIAAMRRNRECSSAWLFKHVYGRRARFTKRNVLKAHIWQLRKMGYPIAATSRGRHPSRYEWEERC